MGTVRIRNLCGICQMVSIRLGFFRWINVIRLPDRSSAELLPNLYG